MVYCEDLLNQKVTPDFSDRLKGDPKDTWADITKAQALLNYYPETTLKAGLEQQIHDMCLLDE